MISVWNLQVETVLLRNGLLCCGIEEMDLTIRTRRGGVDKKGPGSLGKARWQDRVILGQGEGFGDVQKANLGRKWVETEDEGKSSCEKLRAVMAVLLLVAVCQNTLSDIKINAKIPKTGISDLQNIFPPRSVGPPWVGGLPNSRSTTCGRHYL